MKLKPILFSTTMVQAILDGRKTQTRRKAKVPYGDYFGTDIMDWGLSEYPHLTNGKWMYSVQTDVDNYGTYEIHPKYQVGDVLWVRETWQYNDDLEEPYLYKQKFLEDYRPEFHDLMKWKPSIFMPKEAARIFLRVTNVRVERLQDISEEDAMSEGVNNYLQGKDTPPVYENYMVKNKDFKEDGWAHVANDAIDSFKTLWESINGTESWEENPFVFVYDFEITEKP